MIKTRKNNKLLLICLSLLYIILLTISSGQSIDIGISNKSILSTPFDFTYYSGVDYTYSYRSIRVLFKFISFTHLAFIYSLFSNKDIRINLFYALSYFIIAYCILIICKYILLSTVIVSLTNFVIYLFSYLMGLFLYRCAVKYFPNININITKKIS